MPTGWETWKLFGRPSTSVIEWLLGTLSCWQPWSWRDYKESPISSPRSAVLSDHCELNLLWDSDCMLQSCVVAHENNRQLSSALWPVNSLWVNFCQLQRCVFIEEVFDKQWSVPTQGLYFPSPWTFDQTDNTKHELSSYGAGLRSNQKVVCYPVTAKPLLHSEHILIDRSVLKYSGSSASKTMDTISPTPAHTALTALWRKRVSRSVLA